MSNFFYSSADKKMYGYIPFAPEDSILAPYAEESTYKITQNGTYTFKVYDITTGKTYKKSIEVTNIDQSLPPYIVTTKTRNKWTYILMFDASKNDYTTFEKAYIILDGEKIELNEYDINETDFENKAVASTVNNTLDQLVSEGKLKEKPNLYGT